VDRIAIMHPDGMAAVREIPQSLLRVHSFEQGHDSWDDAVREMKRYLALSEAAVSIEKQARTLGSRINRPVTPTYRREAGESQVGERRHVAGGPRISFVHLKAESTTLPGGADDEDVNRANRFQPGFVPRGRRVRWAIGRSD
jgi:hypothetical protein